VNKPRITLVSACLGGGGAERVMATLANGFDTEGFAVDMVLMQASGEYIKDLSPSIRLVNLGAPRAGFALLPLVRYLRSARPEAILVTQAHINLIAIMARAIARIPTCLVVRETSTPSVIAARARSVRGWTQLGLVRLLYRFADMIVAPSIGVKDDLTEQLGLPRTRVRVINNPLSLSLIGRRAEEPVEHRWFAQPDVPIIVGIGRLSSQKDFPTLLKALAKVRATRPARLIILGEGEDREALSKLAAVLNVADAVDFAGFVQNPYAYLRRSSVYVLSSPSEGSPNTLLEALAVGVPVVATDCQSGPREILEGGRWGRLVAVGDADAMAAGIVDAFDGRLHSPTSKELAERYGSDAVLKDYLTLFDKSVRNASQQVVA
jgi:glycosyltransferase involved in cell wall biosynthesis